MLVTHPTVIRWLKIATYVAAFFLPPLVLVWMAVRGIQEVKKAGDGLGVTKRDVGMIVLAGTVGILSYAFLFHLLWIATAVGAGVLLYWRYRATLAPDIPDTTPVDVVREAEAVVESARAAETTQGEAR